MALDTTPRPADSDYDLLRKILTVRGGIPRPGDTYNRLLQKILIEFGGIPRPGDLDHTLYYKILLRLGGVPRPGDTQNKLLQKIVIAAGGEAPIPGDYDNILLRKLLLSAVDAGEFAGITIDLEIVEVEIDQDELEITLTFPEVDPEILNFWFALGEWHGPLETSDEDIANSPDWNVLATFQLTSSPFTITIPFPEFPLSDTPLRLCFKKGIAPTEQAAIDIMLLVRPVTTCFIIPYDVPGFAPDDCAFDVTNGGGDNFECYLLGLTDGTGQNGGSALLDSWVFVDSEFGVQGTTETFETYPLGDVEGETLNAPGTGLTGPWVFTDSVLGVQGAETFETYPLGDVEGETLDAPGTGLTGPWSFTNSDFVRYYDDFESYPLGATDGTGLNGGTGFSGDGGTGFSGSWVFTDA